MVLSLQGRPASPGRHASGHCQPGPGKRQAGGWDLLETASRPVCRCLKFVSNLNLRNRGSLASPRACSPRVNWKLRVSGGPTVELQSWTY
jgi:hypothetical protein